jgi:HD domain-containing protein
VDARELIPGFEPETDLERRLSSEPELLEGLAWGEPRAGHPEGAVGTHVSHLLEALDQSGASGEERELLRFMALVHDSFKYQVRERLPRVGENHHAMRARRFAEGFTDDERLLAAIEFHDRPYALWRKLKRRGKLDERALLRMLRRIPDPELFLRFVELDGSTEGKRPEPIEWFREQLMDRGLIDPAAAAESTG